MATVHINGERGDVAETVLMPGDPRRAEHIAERYLESPRKFNDVRSMSGFTGTYHGHRLSVMAHGMGGPSVGIYAHELITHFGARTLVRVGSCGSLQERIRVGDLVLAQAASYDSNWHKQFRLRGHLAPCADFELLARAAASAASRGARVHVGGVLSSDMFYAEAPTHHSSWGRLGVLAVEMETAVLYTEAARHGIRALAVLTVSDEILSGCALSANAREHTFADMVEVALAACFDQNATGESTVP